MFSGRAGLRDRPARLTLESLVSNQTHRSQSDLEARLYRKGDLSSTRLSYLTHDLIDTKSRVILRRRVSQVTGSAEREVALQMLDEVLQARTELGLPKAPEILTADTGYGSAEFVADVLERGITPHVPLLSSANDTPLVTYQRRTFDRVRGPQAKGENPVGHRVSARALVVHDGWVPGEPEASDPK